MIKQQSIPFRIFLIVFVCFSVIFTFDKTTFCKSLSIKSSTLIFNAFESNFNCSGFGEVSSNSQLEIVCLVTFTFSPNYSCERPFFFLKFKIF